MIQCPQCGQLNEPFFKFCLMCGSSLAGAPSLARGPSRPEPAKPAAKPAAVAPVAKAAVPRPEPVVATKPTVSAEPAAVRQTPVAPPEPVAPATLPEASVQSDDAPAERQAPVVAVEAPAETPAHSSVVVDSQPVDQASASTDAPSAPARAEPPAEATTETVPDDDEELGAHEAPASAPVVAEVAATVAAPEPVHVAPVAAEPAVAPRAEPVQADAARVRRRTRFTLVVIREDASDGERFALDHGLFTVGREGTSVEFPDDVYLDALHASVDVSEHAVMVLDQGSVNGTFLRLQSPVLLKHGSEVRIGQQLLRLELVGDLAPLHVSTDGSDLLGGPVPEAVWGRFVSVLAPDFDGDAFLLEGATVQIGRERGDITFPFDGYVSGRHAKVTRDGSGARIEDLGSSNGTYVRLTGPTPVKPGALILFGQQLFRLEG